MHGGFMSVNLILRRLMQRDSSEFEVSLGYVMSSKLAWTTEWYPVSENKKYVPSLNLYLNEREDQLFLLSDSFPLIEKGCVLVVGREGCCITPMPFQAFWQTEKQHLKDIDFSGNGENSLPFFYVEKKVEWVGDIGYQLVCCHVLFPGFNSWSAWATILCACQFSAVP